jgi:hypothetical protein
VASSHRLEQRVVRRGGIEERLDEPDAVGRREHNDLRSAKSVFGSRHGADYDKLVNGVPPEASGTSNERFLLGREPGIEADGLRGIGFWRNIDQPDLRPCARGARLIYSGVDWSQEVGGPILVIAAPFIDASELDRLDKELAQVRVQIRKGPDYPFKHVHARESTRRLFYPALCRIPSLEAHVLILDTVTWIDQFKSVKVQRGDTRVRHAMATLVTECPDHLIEGHIMRIDIPKEEVRTVALPGYWESRSGTNCDQGKSGGLQSRLSTARPVNP